MKMGRTHAKKTKAGRPPQKKKTSTSDDLLHTSRAFTLTLSHPPQPAPGLQPAAKICVVRLLRALLVHELRPVPGGEGAEDPRGHPGVPGALPRPPFRRYRRRARTGHHGLGAARQRDPCPSVCRPGEALEEVNQAAKLFCFVCLAFLPRSWCGAFPRPLLKRNLASQPLLSTGLHTLAATFWWPEWGLSTKRTTAPDRADGSWTRSSSPQWPAEIVLRHC